MRGEDTEVEEGKDVVIMMVLVAVVMVVVPTLRVRVDFDTKARPMPSFLNGCNKGGDSTAIPGAKPRWSKLESARE